jgi:hypothetical protein
VQTNDLLLRKLEEVVRVPRCFDVNDADGEVKVLALKPGAFPQRASI